jgi:hypothetical protein
MLDLEDNTVVECLSGDFTDDLANVVDVVVERFALKVDVPSRPTFPERGQEHPALQDELIGIG